MADTGGESWVGGYAERVAALAADAGRTNARLARQWGERSLDDREWTVDSLTADALEAWDHLTPLAERGIELWLELVQHALSPGRPDGH